MRAPVNVHWHAFSYNGHEVPPDSEAGSPSTAVMPRDLNHWFTKPKSMRRGTYTTPEGAFAWLRREVEGTPPPNFEDLETYLRYHRDQLQRGQDGYAGYYTSGGGILVHAREPGRPRGTGAARNPRDAMPRVVT